MDENSMIGDAKTDVEVAFSHSITISARSVSISAPMKTGQGQVEMIEEFERVATAAAEQMLAKHREHGGLEMSPREALAFSYSYGEAPRLTIEPSPKAIRSLGGINEKSSPLKAAEAAFKLAGQKLPGFTKLGLMIMGRWASPESQQQVASGIQKDIIAPMARKTLMASLAIAVIEEHGRYVAERSRPGA